MGSVLAVMAVTVSADVPAGLHGAVVMVRTDPPPMIGWQGENDAVAPLGSPLTLRLTGVPYRSLVAWKEIRVLVTPPARTVAAGELNCIV